MFRFVLPLGLFLSHQYIVLFNPSANLHDTVLQFSIIASFVRRLRETNRSDVFLAFNLSFNEIVVHTIE